MILGTPNSKDMTVAMMLGCGELGKEVVIELQRLGVYVVGVDRYPNAPAMQVAHESYVADMLDGDAIRVLVEQVKPHFIIPEIEAIATETLVMLESEGFNVVPTARAVNLTMNRQGIRTLVAEKLGIQTSPYAFADTYDEYKQAITDIGLPCVVKPIMSSSGKGQSTVMTIDDIDAAWDYSQEGGRTGAGRIIVEGFVEFDYEITLLTVKHINGVSFCSPIGHIQEDGDYRVSWQPAIMEYSVLDKAQQIAKTVVENLCSGTGRGIFGVELFIQGDEVYFSEVSPRPHDTGLVTLASQRFSEFALHARAVLGLPVNTEQSIYAASYALLAEGKSSNIRFGNLEEALDNKSVDVRFFGKQTVDGRRRVGVVLATHEHQLEAALEDAEEAAEKIEILL
jgi:phosphoribosylglycinamide formyltransferase 2